MVFSLTDETYSLLCSMARPADFTDREWKAATFFTAFFDQCYWIAGSVLGALMGELITFDTTGIDFAMTALFVVIFVEQWMEVKNRIPEMIGVAAALLCLSIFGADNFVLPSMLLITFLLFVGRTRLEKEVEG